ncbi:ATP-dependent Clp protease adaptor protein ClpS [Clostridium sp. DSM 8431]|nr:ATP-dependent Clp protease adaptor protein ClpS [Clostridium sp. DSM 8431]
MSIKDLTIEKTKTRLKEPKKYKVVMYNDDFTPMDFVVYILVNIFRKKHDDATNIMMKVHKEGSAVVGTYSYDIAVTKVEKANFLAKEEGFPFKIKVQEA